MSGEYYLCFVLKELCASAAWSLQQCKRLQQGLVERTKVPGLLKKIRRALREQVTLVDQLIVKHTPRPRLASSPIPQSTSSSVREQIIPNAVKDQERPSFRE